MEATTRKRRLILISLVQHFAALFSVFMQFHGLMYLYMLYRKRNIDLVVAHFARKRNLFLRKCKDLKLRRLRRKQRSTWFNNGRTDQWWKNMFTGVSPEEDCKRNFRMTRQEFDDLCEQLRPHISPNPKSPNRRALTVEKKVAVALYYLKDTGSMWMTANTFGIHQCTVSRVVLEGFEGCHLADSVSRAGSASAITWKIFSPVSRDPGNAIPGARLTGLKIFM